MASATPAAWRITLTMCAAEMLSMTGFAAFTTLLPVLMREWGLNNSQAGAIGFTAALPWFLVVALMCVNYAAMLGDSAALTAGTVASAPPELRGATMAVYSFLGFGGALVAPLVFGAVLDLAGGNQSRFAWDFAFASIGIFGALAPVGRRWYARRA